MTTILCIKQADFIIIAADRQVTEGNLKFPSPYQKLSLISSNCIIGAAGSVGMAQRLVDITRKDLLHSKIDCNLSDLTIFPEEFSSHLAKLNFSFPLEYKHFSPCNYIVAGLEEDEQPVCNVIGDDGSLIPIEKFIAIGSGSDFALSLLAGSYKELSREEASGLAYQILRQVSGLDCFTNDSLDLFIICKEGINKIIFEPDKPSV